jgi:hypothetical protein
MSDGFPNKPKILRGAFVEFGLSLPPLIVVFQFNPLQLTRNRALTFAANGTSTGGSIRDFHGKYMDLLDLRREQVVTVQEQTLGFELRLDASDRLDAGDAITEQFGVAPQISTLELMVSPKEEGILNGVVSDLLGSPPGFSFQGTPKPPLILFVFGRKRVLPVNINSLNITETEFSADLNPVRATVTVSLTVIEGPSVPYQYTQAMTEAMSLLNLANLTDVASVVIPG